MTPFIGPRFNSMRARDAALTIKTLTELGSPPSLRLGVLLRKAFGRDRQLFAAGLNAKSETSLPP